MKLKPLFFASVLALLVAATACEKSSPTAPAQTTGAAVGGAVVANATVTVGAGQPISPADGKAFKFVEQPVTLVISNGVTTASTAPTHTFEVATDSGFTAKVYTKDGVAEGANGQTAITIDRLGPAKTYYWRSHPVVSGVAGLNTAVRNFVIGAEIILQPAVLASPENNTTVLAAKPTLVTNNIQRTGPAGPITYRFELSDSSSFGSQLFTATVAEQAGSQTSVQVPTQLRDRVPYFWRVQASDASNSITTPFSPVFSFQVQSFDITRATIWNNPPDFNNWAETAAITAVEFTGSAILVDFDRRDGPGRWPDVGFGTGSLEYTLGMCVNIDGNWNCSATVQFWYGRELEASGSPYEIGINWWYDARWGRLLGYQPAQGELVGIYVGAGNLRDNGNVILKERSNVVIMPFGGSYRAR